MALVEYNQSQIEVEIPNLVIAGFGEFKRKAYVENLVINFIERTVFLNLRVKWFKKNEDDTYGDPLEGVSGMTEYYKGITAGTNRIVDIATGEVLAREEELENAENPESPLYNKTYMRQIEWYMMVIHTQSVIVKEAVVSAVYAAAVNNELD
jgi:hypothetical protein